MAQSTSALRRKRRAALMRERRRFEKALTEAVILLSGRVKTVERHYLDDGTRVVDFTMSAGRLEALLKDRRIVLCTFRACPEMVPGTLRGHVSFGFDSVGECPKRECVLTRELRVKP